MPLSLPATADYESRFNDPVWARAAAAICDRHGLQSSGLRRSEQGENIIFFAGQRFVIKIYGPHRDNYRREKAALEFCGGSLGVETPALLHEGEIEGWPYVVMTRLKGRLAREVWHGIDVRGRLDISSRLGHMLKELHGRSAPLSQPALNRDWPGFVERQARAAVARQRSCGANPEWLESLPAYIESNLKLLPQRQEPALLHGDVHLGNLLLEERRGRWEVTGLFDFGDSLCGFHEYDFVAPGVLMLQGRRDLQRAMLLAYGYGEAELDEKLRARLMLLTVLYECSDLRKYATRLDPEAVRLTLAELESAIWKFAAD